jgi:hypothetical protein
MDDVNKKLDAILEQVTRLDSIKDEISAVRVIQARHEENLKDHMRRSLANEKNGHRLEALIMTVKDGLERKLRPIQKHVDRVQFLFVLVVSAGALAGAAKAIYEVVGVLTAGGSSQ